MGMYSSCVFHQIQYGIHACTSADIENFKVVVIRGYFAVVGVYFTDNREEVDEFPY